MKLSSLGKKQLLDGKETHAKELFEHLKGLGFKFNPELELDELALRIWRQCFLEDIKRQQDMFDTPKAPIRMDAYFNLLDFEELKLARKLLILQKRKHIPHGN